MTEIAVAPLSADAFSRFGDVLDAAGPPDRMINRGLCGRYHDRARIDVAGSRAGISIFRAEIRRLPLTLDMVERHPFGSQAFLPLSNDPFLVVVAEDRGGTPGHPLALLTAPHQGVNFRRGVWHGVLTPLSGPGLFAVVDRIGPGDNLEEHWFDPPYTVVAAR